MAIEFIKDIDSRIQVEKIERNHEDTATTTTNLGYIAISRLDGKIHFSGYRIDDLEQILSKMKELQEELEVTKNCGSCKWWDDENSTYSNAAEEMKASCKYKMPFWVCADTFKSFESDGQNCPTWEERK